MHKQFHQPHIPRQQAILKELKEVKKTEKWKEENKEMENVWNKGSYLNLLGS